MRELTVKRRMIDVTGIIKQIKKIICQRYEWIHESQWIKGGK